MLRKLALVTAAGATLAIGIAFMPSQASAQAYSYGFYPQLGLYSPAYYRGYRGYRYYGWRRPYWRYYRWGRPYYRPYAYTWRRPYWRYRRLRRWW